MLIHGEDTGIAELRLDFQYHFNKFCKKLIRVLAKLFGIGVFTPEHNETKVIVS